MLSTKPKWMYLVAANKIIQCIINHKQFSADLLEVATEIKGKDVINLYSKEDTEEKLTKKSSG